MRSKMARQWLEALGYQESPDALHLLAGRAASGHPYAREIDALLDKDGDVQAAAVFDVDRVPTVCFVEASGKLKADAGWLNSIRQKIWNQSLVSLLLVIDGDKLIPYPIRKGYDAGHSLPLADATPDGLFSARDIQSGDVQRRHTDWFSLDARVDRELLHNLKHGVIELIKQGIDRDSAQTLLGQCLFVSYLEHRGIVSSIYRERRGVGQLHDLIATANASGLVKLFKHLKDDFNGDFLGSEQAHGINWRELSVEAYGLLHRFLGRVNIETGQGSLWNYDFRFIPVELLSGIYETFLGDDQEKLGAYYTPRHLANLAVDQAFAFSRNIAEEVVFDGACGSGILLTTAFRRMISAAEHASGKPLHFLDRRALLERGIRGGDVSRAACRVTAFSLYLSLMEDLRPRDILLLQEDANVKLPPLIDKTIVCGKVEGDFFSPKQRFASVPSCTVFLSNPPWGEPSGGTKNLPYEKWATAHDRFLPRRQIAAAFAHKALDVIQEDGRFCLILPATLLTAPTSQQFLREWLLECRIDRVINFSDIRRLLFSEAVHPCFIVTGHRRPAGERGKIPYNEFIDYWVPKADIGIAFGRLTVHGADRHRLLANAVWADNQELRTYIWGTRNDASLIARLTLDGTVEDLTSGNNARWAIVKGFNQQRHTSPPLPVTRLKKLRFLNTRDIPRDAPVLDPQVLRPFPSEITSVVSYGSNDGAAFSGPRVLFPDGASSEFEVNAVFASEPFCFKHSVAAIRGPDEDEDTLRFFTMYLRSSLARYLLLHTAYSLSAERPRITLKEIKNLPFTMPDRHQKPKRAEAIIKLVAGITRAWEQADVFSHYKNAAKHREKCDRLIFEYFGLTERDVLLVQDACNVSIPSVQPTTYDAIRTPFYAPPSHDDLQQHASYLASELDFWKTRLGGKGGFKVDTVATPIDAIGALGIVRISLSRKSALPKVRISDLAVTELVKALISDQVMPMKLWTSLHVSADFLIQADDEMYLVKPLVKRLWLRTRALSDARRIVEAVRYPDKQSA